MLSLGFKLWLWKKKQKFTNMNFAKPIWQLIKDLALPIFAIWLADTANNIAKASYALARNDRTQQEQINQLKSIIDNQKIQIDTLINVSKKLEEQNRLTQKQNLLTQDQSIELTSQGKKISAQLHINQIQQEENLKNIFFRRKASFSRLYNTFKDIGNLPTTGRGQDFLEYDNDQQNAFLNQTRILLEKESENLYLLEHKDAFESWYDFFGVIISELSSRKMNLTLIIADDKGQHKANEMEKAKFAKRRWENITAKYSKFLGKIGDTIVPKGLKEFDYILSPRPH